MSPSRSGRHLRQAHKFHFKPRHTFHRDSQIIDVKECTLASIRIPSSMKRILAVGPLSQPVMGFIETGEATFRNGEPNPDCERLVVINTGRS